MYQLEMEISDNNFKEHKFALPYESYDEAMRVYIKYLTRAIKLKGKVGHFYTKIRNTDTNDLVLHASLWQREV